MKLYAVIRRVHISVPRHLCWTHAPSFDERNVYTKGCVPPSVRLSASYPRCRIYCAGAEPVPSSREKEAEAPSWETSGVQINAREASNDDVRRNHTAHSPRRARSWSSPDVRAEHYTTTSAHPEECPLRREWQPPCEWWSHNPHHRYLLYGPTGTYEGIGGNLMRIAWVFNRAISYDLEVVFESPLKAGHDVGTIGPWFGTKGNSLLAIQDPLKFSLAKHVDVPSWDHNQSYSEMHEHSVNWYDPTEEDQWFHDRRKEKSVVYIPHPKTLNKYRYWGQPTFPTPKNSTFCSHARYAVQRVFWNAPHKRDRCRSTLKGIEGVADPEKSGRDPAAPRPWFIAMHMRRGDKIDTTHEERSVPYFQAAAQAILRSVARITPGGEVFFAVFSEGEIVDESDGGTGELQLVDYSGKPMELDVPRDYCRDVGLNCTQELALNTTAFNAMECLATADLLIADKSQFSEAAAALSTNVKVVHRPSEQDQYAVLVDKPLVVKYGRMGESKEMEIYEAAKSWYDCYNEARILPDRSAKGDRRVYQTIDV